MKSVYDNLLADLHLQADEVPLIAGEVVKDLLTEKIKKKDRGHNL